MARRGFLLLEINNKLYHLSLCYLQPRRPTWLRMKFTGRKMFGREGVEPLFMADGQPDNCLDFEAFDFVDTDRDIAKTPMQCTVWKLVSFKRPVHPFVPCKCLCVEPLHLHSDRYKDTNSTIQYWKALECELQDHRNWVIHGAQLPEATGNKQLRLLDNLRPVCGLLCGCLCGLLRLPAARPLARAFPGCGCG